MNEQRRSHMLRKIEEAMENNERSHSPEELARAAHELEQDILPAAIAQGKLNLPLRPGPPNDETQGEGEPWR